MNRHWSRFPAVALFAALLCSAWWVSRGPGDGVPPLRLLSEEHKRAVLEDAQAKSEARRRFRNELVTLLVEGRLSLREAAQRLLAYHDEEWGNVPEGADEWWYGRGVLRAEEVWHGHQARLSEQARHARSLLLHVAQRLGTAPGAASVLARLEREAGELIPAGLDE